MILQMTLNDPKAEIHLVGHGYGSLVAQAIVKKNPKLIMSLTLVGMPELPILMQKQSWSHILSNWHDFFFQLPYIAEAWFNHDDLQGIRWAWNMQSIDKLYNHAMVANVTEWIYQRNCT